MNHLALPWGTEKISIALPDGWRTANVLEPSPLPGVADPAEAIRCSLHRPIGSAPLADLARPGMKIAIVIDDASRPTPIAAILPGVLAELDQAGARRENITLVTALGVHRSMNQSEIEQRAGALNLIGLRCENHACLDPDRLVTLGTTRRGTLVSINKTVAQSDLVISIGCIEPHLIASFGGGYKNLVPGVAGHATIAHNHALNCRADTFNMVGQPIERNPMRLDLEEAAAMLKPPVFIVNAVLNSQQQIVGVVSGDPIAAHREGARLSQSIYSVKIASPADVVIADSHPMDRDLRQGSKALANTIRAVRRGGVQIILMRAEEGLGEFGLADRKLPVGRSGLQRLSPLLVRLVPRLKIKGLADDERFFLYFALQAMRHGTLLVYAPTVPIEKRHGLPFVEFVDSPQAAIEQAQRLINQPIDALIFPYGGVTYPSGPD
jgi:nickel-dependent lactate racemase